ncbi:MAG TPA: FAD-dependent monooxygenase [Gemmatimonadaceae bacterium]
MGDGDAGVSSRPRILIVGGGIAGLTLAALLRQRGECPEIVERTRDYGGVGYAIALWPAGSDILKGLGLYGALEAVAMRGERYEIHDEHAALLNRSSFAAVERRFGPAHLVERSRFIDVLREGTEGVRLRMGTSVEALRDVGREVHVTFTDGTSGRYDLVVGADGLRSRVRELVFGAVRPRYLGMTGWAFWLPEPAYAIVPPGMIREFWGAGRFGGLYPVPGRVCAFVAATAREGTPDPVAHRVARLRELFAEFRGAAAEPFAHLPSAGEIWHDDFLDLRMPSWHRGRVVLIGDAAHAILPTAGIGASMAMESAAVLADELSRTDAGYVERALERYAARRKPRVDRVQRESRLLGKLVALSSPPLVTLRDAGVRRLRETTIAKGFARVLAGPI